MELMNRVDMPSGLVNVVHGGKDVVDMICDHPDIRAVSFVGGNKAGEYIHQRATSHNKRAQCNMGAKNHGTVLPDADRKSTINALIGAAFGWWVMLINGFPTSWQQPKHSKLVQVIKRELILHHFVLP